MSRLSVWWFGGRTVTDYDLRIPPPQPLTSTETSRLVLDLGWRRRSHFLIIDSDHYDPVRDRLDFRRSTCSFLRLSSQGQDRSVLIFFQLDLDFLIQLLVVLYIILLRLDIRQPKTIDLEFVFQNRSQYLKLYRLQIGLVRWRTIFILRPVYVLIFKDNRYVLLCKIN